MRTEILQSILDAARRAAPREVCGLLSGTTAIAAHHELPNADDTHDTFLIDPLAFARCENQLLRAGQRVLGAYHSHPVGPPIPSIRDQQLRWPGRHLIVSLDGRWSMYEIAGTWRLQQQGRL